MNDGLRHVGVKELFEEIGGSTYFTKDQLLRQLASCEDEGEDFDLIHGEALYRIPLARIADFFKEHKRPSIPMTMKQENEYLKKRITDMEEKVAKMTGKEKAEFKAKTHKDKTVSPEPVGKSNKLKTEVPPEKERKKESLSTIQAELKEQVKDKQPVTSKGEPKSKSKAKPKKPKGL